MKYPAIRFFGWQYPLHPQKPSLESHCRRPPPPHPSSRPLKNKKTNRFPYPPLNHWWECGSFCFVFVSYVIIHYNYSSVMYTKTSLLWGNRVRSCGLEKFQVEITAEELTWHSDWSQLWKTSTLYTLYQAQEHEWRVTRSPLLSSP